MQTPSPQEPVNERIAAAALRLGGVVFSMPRPARHHTIFHALYEVAGPLFIGAEQGFLTGDGRFVDRVEGLAIATVQQQIITKHGYAGHLFSEDCW